MKTSTQLNSAVFRLVVGLLVLVLFTSCAEKTIPEVDQTQLLTKEQAMVVAVDYVHLLADSTYELRLTPEKSAELGIAPKDYESMHRSISSMNATIQKAIARGETNIEFQDPQSPELKSKRTAPRKYKTTTPIVRTASAGTISVIGSSEGRSAFSPHLHARPSLSASCTSRDFGAVFTVWCESPAGQSTQSGTCFMAYGTWDCTLTMFVEYVVTQGLGFRVFSGDDHGGSASFSYEYVVLGTQD